MRNCPKRVFLATLGVLTPLIINTSAFSAGPRQTEVPPETLSKPIPAPVEYRFSRDVGAGRLVRAQEGKEGKVVRTYELKRTNGKVTGKEILSEIRIEPEPTILLMGRAGWQRS
ncbi:MAG: hypothetical protein C4320_02405, partial [Armatimonadota bacterium]